MPTLSTGPGGLLDLATYPVDDLASPAARALIEHGRAALADEGVCILPGFLTQTAVEVLVSECTALSPVAHRSDVRGTPYLGLPPDDLPRDHPRCHLVRSALAVVAYDQLPAHSPMRALYEWDELMAFVAALLGLPAVYRYADPFGALNLAVMRDGDELGWHFDQTDFVLSLALQSADAGGSFESAAFIRDTDDERYEDVKAVLEGRAPERVATLPMVPGTLMLFAGRRSLHRVTPISGPVPRYVALLAYDTKPGTDSTELLKLVRYGRLP